MHVPPNSEAVRDAMPVFFEMLSEETEPSARVVLGHFIFVYIHPYMDGNGRVGRFLMNLMLAAGGCSLDCGTAGTAGCLYGRSGGGKRAAQHRAVRQFPRAPCGGGGSWQASGQSAKRLKMNGHPTCYSHAGFR